MLHAFDGSYEDSITAQGSLHQVMLVGYMLQLYDGLLAHLGLQVHRAFGHLREARVRDHDVWATQIVMLI